MEVGASIERVVEHDLNLASYLKSYVLARRHLLTEDQDVEGGSNGQ